jgi:hypothetical protein
MSMAIQEAIRPCTCCTCTALDHLFPHEGVQLALLSALSLNPAKERAPDRPEVRETRS